MIYSKEITEDLLPLVNDLDMYARLHDFAKYKIEKLRDELEKGGDEQLIRGKLLAFREILNMKEYVLANRNRIEKERGAAT